MIVSVLNRTWEPHVTSADPADAPNDVYVEVRHKPRFGEKPVPWSGLRFGLLEAEAYRIAQPLIQATNNDRQRSLTAMESLRANARKPRKPIESARPDCSSPKSGSGSRFTRTQGRYLAFIHRYMTKYGVAPAEADIQRHFLVSAPSVNAMMQTLTRRGLISRVPGVARSIRLLVPVEELPQP